MSLRRTGFLFCLLCASVWLVLPAFPVRGEEAGDAAALLTAEAVSGDNTQEAVVPETLKVSSNDAPEQPEQAGPEPVKEEEKEKFEEDKEEIKEEPAQEKGEKEEKEEPAEEPAAQIDLSGTWKARLNDRDLTLRVDGGLYWLWLDGTMIEAGSFEIRDGLIAGQANTGRFENHFEYAPDDAALTLTSKQGLSLVYHREAAGRDAEVSQ